MHITDQDSLIHPVILSGGAGTRLWPLSLPSRPKQFFPLLSDRSMIQETVLRAAGVASFARPLIVGSDRHKALLQDQMDAIGVDLAGILLEPEGRNTAMAIAVAAQWIVQQNGDGLMLVMPSDHMIAQPQALLDAAQGASRFAQDGYLVTFGVVPTAPETGFGYIAQGDALDGQAGVHAVDRFIEKPPLADAQAYVDQGGYHWNSGIFLFRASSLLEALAAHCPDVAAAGVAAMTASTVDGYWVMPDPQAFASAPSISIDHAVMERTERAAVVPLEMGWSDVGSWQAIWAMRDRADDGNSVHGEGFMHDARGNLIFVDGGAPVAAIGVDNCVIVSTADGVLIMPRERSQDVRVAAEHFRNRRLV